MNTMTLIKARSAIVHFLRTPGSHRKRTGASPYGLLAHTISHRVFRNSHRNFETPGSNLPDTVFRRGKKISGTLELDHIRLCFCLERWFAVTAVKEAGHEGSMVRSILMAIKHVRHPLRPCPRPCLPSGLMKVPPFDRGHSELPSHLFPKGKHQVWGELPGSFEDLAGFSKDPVRYSIPSIWTCNCLLV